MNPIKYIKSFNKGQITIPKEFRDIFGITQEFWLKMYIEKGKLIAEPIEGEQDRSGYRQKLLKITGDWFSTEEVDKNRQDLEKQLAGRSL